MAIASRCRANSLPADLAVRACRSGQKVMVAPTTGSASTFSDTGCRHSRPERLQVLRWPAWKLITRRHLPPRLAAEVMTKRLSGRVRKLALERAFDIRVDEIDVGNRKHIADVKTSPAVRLPVIGSSRQSASGCYGESGSDTSCCVLERLTIRTSANPTASPCCPLCTARKSSEVGLKKLASAGTRDVLTEGGIIIPRSQGGQAFSISFLHALAGNTVMPLGSFQARRQCC